MHHIATLIENLPPINQSRMVANGLVLWMVWDGQITRAVEQSLEDHGGIKVTTVGTQSLWWFASNEVFKGLARLQLWARLNPMTTMFQIFQGNLLVGWNNEISLSIPGDLAAQEALKPEEFEAFVHPKCVDGVKRIPGIDLKQLSGVPGFAQVEWRSFHTDPGFSFETSLAWYFIAKPIGNNMDKEFSLGWRHFYNSIEPIMQRMGLKYIYNDQNIIILVPNIRLLKAFLKDIVVIIREQKADSESRYWPCVLAAVAREGLNFNEEMPRKVGLDWGRLTPDYPHVTYKTAYLLGDEFKINQMVYFNDRLGIDNWCYVSMAQADDSGLTAGSLQVGPPRRLQAGAEEECYYCGLKNHKTQECPSRQISLQHKNLWEQLAMINTEDINSIGEDVDKAMSGRDAIEAIAELLEGNDKPSLLVRAIYENSLPMQLRMLAMVWRSRSKDWSGAFDNLAPEEGEYIWAALESLRANNLANAEHLVQSAINKYPRNYQPRSLQGLIQIEMEDYTQGLFFLQESERLSYTPVQRAVLCFLQARLLEVQQEFDKAISLYKQAESHAKYWSDSKYRQGVCLVKMGFTDHALGIFLELIKREPNYFNRLLIDPELERGRFNIQSGVWDLWTEALENGLDARDRVEELKRKVAQWFTPEHEYTEIATNKLERLTQLTRVKNYVAIRRLVSGANGLEEELKEKINTEITEVEKKVEQLLGNLIEIQREASWFPFPKLLREFNKDFNFCAEKLNWMKTQQLNIADNFRKAQMYNFEIEERLEALRSRLVTLRVIRDSTFFVLLLGRNFIWLELVGLGLALVLVPLIVYFGQSYISGWAADLVLRQKWQLQKGLVIVLSVIAIAVSVVRTAVVFEKKKEKLFTEEYNKALEAKLEKRKKRKEVRQKAIAAKREAVREAAKKKDSSS